MKRRPGCASVRNGRANPVETLESRRLFSAITFGPPAHYLAGTVGTPPGRGAEHVAVGDFNGDGAADLVVAGNDVTVTPAVRHSVRVLLNRGDGTFAPPSEPAPAGTNLSGLAVGDFNRDGRLDAVVCDDQEEAMVYVLLGEGDGGFEPARAFHSGSRSQDLAVADFNRDGTLDVAVANAREWAPFGTRQLPMHQGALLFGNGDGTFRREQPIFTGRRPQHFVEAGDVNGDGHIDTVFGQVVIGPGDFAAPESRVFASIAFLDVPVRQPTTVPAAITGLKLADLNGDGRLDVAASANRDLMSGGGVAVTLAGRGDGTFADPLLWEPGAVRLVDVDVADFNADGRPDLALAGDDPRFMRPTPVPAVITLENLGGDAYSRPSFFFFGGNNYPGGLAVGRLNRDRLPDVALALPETNQVGVRLNTTRTLTATGVRLRGTAGVPITAQVARFNVTGPVTGVESFNATIYWGDGTRPTAGSIVVNKDGSFGVLGTHTYRRAGLYRVLVVIRWPEAQLSRMVTSSALVTWPRVGATS